MGDGGSEGDSEGQGMGQGIVQGWVSGWANGTTYEGDFKRELYHGDFVPCYGVFNFLEFVPVCGLFNLGRLSLYPF